MRLGIDFDNTIVRYDDVFAAAARSRGWIAQDFAGTKKQVRDTVRLLDRGEDKWQMLQAEVYGKRMVEASPFPGVLEFLRAARTRHWELFIVSHKTRYSAFDPEQTDLRVAALGWMERHKLLDPDIYGLTRDRVFFADTRGEKVARIAALQCAAFIDDLEEVFEHADFPPATRQILFSSDNDAVPAGGRATSLRTWQDIHTHVLGEGGANAGVPSRLTGIAARLSGREVIAVTAARPGGNNRLYRVETSDGGTYALKSYFRSPNDPRDRLATEFQALRFLRDSGVAMVPAAISCDRDENLALYEWIEGAPPQHNTASVDAALALVRRLNEVSTAPGAQSLPLASEACLSGAAVVEQVAGRLKHLEGAAQEHPELRAFLDDVFRPAFQKAVDTARRQLAAGGQPFDEALADARRRLSPSDFGFHNALRRPDGQIVFIDFEYFGWDDPVKLVSDFVLHPGMDLTDDLGSRFLRGALESFGADPGFEVRLRGSLPLFALRWVMILLNEYLPERWQRRVHAGYRGDRGTVLAGQMNKARRMLGRAVGSEGSFWQ